ncbi:MAG: phosphodiester glycosidase family protein [Holophagales bacterium]|nr:phosphodiester glycosidase family protein [Holophagales bacterium]
MHHEQLRRAAVILCLAATGMVPAFADGRPVQWRTLAPGMELAQTRAQSPSSIGDSKITILRMDPERWELDILAISQTGDAVGRTAREWSREHGLVAAINAGMFATDYKTHVGYLRHGEHINNGRFSKYQSVVAFGRRTVSEPHFRIFDLDAPGIETGTILQHYDSVIQNLRLIKRPGENRWSQQNKRWSEAALGEDSAGRILFIFCRSPYSMYDLNHELLALDLGLVAAQHLEGGPEAQLFIGLDDLEIEQMGSYETSFREDDGNQAAWPVPIVLGVRPRSEKRAE